MRSDLSPQAGRGEWNSLLQFFKQPTVCPRHDLSGFCIFIGPLSKRGRREGRAPTAPEAPCAESRERVHTGLTGTAGTSRPSPREGLTAYFVLSSVSGLFCHRRRRGTYQAA